MGPKEGRLTKSAIGFTGFRVTDLSLILPSSLLWRHPEPKSHLRRESVCSLYPETEIGYDDQEGRKLHRMCNQTHWNFRHLSHLIKQQWRKEGIGHSQQRFSLCTYVLFYCRFSMIVWYSASRLPDGKIWSLPFLGLHVVGGRGAQSKERKGSNFAA